MDFPGGPNIILRVLNKNDAGKSDTWVDNVRIKVEIELMEPQLKEYWQPPEAGRNKEPSVPWSLQKEPVLLASCL